MIRTTFAIADSCLFVEQTERTMAERAKRRFRYVTIVSALVLSSALLLVNLYPRVQLGRLGFCFSGYNYHHGWPWPYMSRDAIGESRGMGGGYLKPWPFFGSPPLVEFTPFLLALDVGIAVLLIAASCIAIETWLRLRKCTLRLRFGMRSMLGATALCCIATTIGVLLLGAKGFIEIVLVICLHVIPNSVIVIYICMLAVFVVDIIRRQY